MGVSLAIARPRARSTIHFSTRIFSPYPGQRNLPLSSFRNQFTWNTRGVRLRFLCKAIQCLKYSPMLYPQKGSMAMGSRRTLPTVPAAAAVISEPMVAPAYTPALQLNAWYTRGMVAARRPPKMIALIGTPYGSSQAGSMVGHWEAGAVKRALGCAA